MNSWLKSKFTWSVLLVVFHLFLLIKFQFTAWPELLVYSHLLRNGFSYYGDIIQPYFPTLPYLLTSIYSMFGLSVFTLRITTYVFILISDVLLIFILNRLTRNNWPVFVLEGFVYVILQVLLEGNGLWFDSATVPFLLIAYIFWQRFNEQKTYKFLVLSGFMTGMAFIIKQSAVWLIVILTLYLFFKKNWKRGIVLAFSTTTPLIILFLFFHPSDVWYWNIYYPFFIMSKSPGYMLLPTLKQLATTIFIFYPLTLIFLKRNKQFLFSLIWLFAASMFIIPRFAYFHLQPALPFLVICLSLLYAILPLKLRIPVTIFYLTGIGFLMLRIASHQLNQPVRFFEPYVYETTARLKSYLPENKSVFFYNDMGNVMVAGGFVPPKPWAYNFPWYMEIPGLQDRIIDSLKGEEIKFIVFAPFGQEGANIPGSYIPYNTHDYIINNFVETASVDGLSILKSILK